MPVTSPKPAYNRAPLPRQRREVAFSLPGWAAALAAAGFVHPPEARGAALSSRRAVVRLAARRTEVC